MVWKIRHIIIKENLERLTRGQYRTGRHRRSERFRTNDESFRTNDIFNVNVKNILGNVLETISLETQKLHFMETISHGVFSPAQRDVHEV